MSATHSPLPWSHSAYEGGWDGVRDKDGILVLKLAYNNPENATFIAEAVNSHARLTADRAKLVEACRLVIERLEGDPSALGNMIAATLEFVLKEVEG